jgi:hypothetical protein
MMNRKAFSVWQALLENPDQWFRLPELGRMTDLTCRQVAALINQMSMPPIERSAEMGDDVVFRFHGTPKEADDLLKSYRRELYHVDQDEMDMISSALSTIGWSSAYDIAEATGMPFLRVTRVVTTMPDVVIASNGSTRSYRKTL